MDKVEKVALVFMSILHEHVPEVDRPSARCDFSDEQWLRIEKATRAAIEAYEGAMGERIAELEVALDALYEAERIHNPDDWTGEPAMIRAGQLLRKPPFDKELP